MCPENGITAPKMAPLDDTRQAGNNRPAVNSELLPRVSAGIRRILGWLQGAWRINQRQAQPPNSVESNKYTFRTSVTIAGQHPKTLFCSSPLNSHFSSNQNKSSLLELPEISNLSSAIEQ